MDDIAWSSTPLRTPKKPAFGLDDALRCSIPVPGTVLGVGHFIQAPLGHSCQAPKTCGLLLAAEVGRLIEEGKWNRAAADHREKQLIDWAAAESQ